MRGDDKVRFCGTCRLNVYDISAMTRGEAERLIQEREGRLCVRFYRRADGRVVTRDCGALARRVAHAAFASICAVIALVFTGCVIGAISWPPFFGGLLSTTPRPRIMGAMLAQPDPALARALAAEQREAEEHAAAAPPKPVHHLGKMRRLPVVPAHDNAIVVDID